MRQRFSRFAPSAPETWGVAFVALLLLLLGNGHDLLRRYGLMQASEVVKNQLGHGVTGGLSKLDEFTVTRSIVNFAIWGAVGLITFSFVHTLIRASGRLEEERELSSNAYMHPAGFSRKNFWHHILLNTFVSFVLLVACIASAILYVFVLLPRSATATGHFLLQPTMGHITGLVAGLAFMFLGTYALYVLLKIAVWHHRANRT